MLFYVNTATGDIDEIDGDSFIVNIDLLPDSLDWEDLDAEDLVQHATPYGAATEIPR